VARTIARVNDPHAAWLFTPALGVDRAVNQADLVAHLIAEAAPAGSASAG
jgi:trk system potassium uptake protein